VDPNPSPNPHYVVGSLGPGEVGKPYPYSNLYSEHRTLSPLSLEVADDTEPIPKHHTMPPLTPGEVSEPVLVPILS
jgi:hypothetical protein